MQRQRLAQMETSLDQARSTIARQRNEIDELRSRIEAGDARLGELLEELREGRTEALEKRLGELEQRGAETFEKRIGELEERRVVAAADLARRLEAVDRGTTEGADRLQRLEERIAALEEGTAGARIRMRLERVGHRIEETERRLAAAEEALRRSVEQSAEHAAEAAKREERLARIESLFEELADEVKQAREEVDLEGIRARLDDLETLVLKTGTEEEFLKQKVGEQARVLESLRDSMVPQVAGDDLTRIRGIGPKYARLLQAMGVTRFAQIAGWTDDDVEHAAGALGIPAARIRKAGWIEAAAALAQD